MDQRDHLRELRDATAARISTLEAQRAELAIERAERPASDKDPSAGDPIGALIVDTRNALAAAQTRLDEIDAALERLDSGTYGHCQGCAQPIPAERLEALPGATHCVTCASRPRR